MFQLLLIFFIDNIISVISSTQIACDVICVQYAQKQLPMFFKEGVLKNFANLTGKHLRQSLFKTADQMICNKILLEKIRAVFCISIKFDLNVRKTGWKKIRFQLALNKTYSLTPPPLIHQRFKHRQRTKINKTMLSTSSVFDTKFTILVLKST